LNSTLQNPVVNYNSIGSYNVRLIASYPGKIDTLTLPNYITVTTLPSTPSISLSNTGDSIILFSSSSTINRWYRNNISVSGINQRFPINSVGSYKVETMDGNGCISSASQELTIPSTYTFIGNGSWDSLGNWNTPIIPPSKLLIGSEVIIDPITNGGCILNRNPTITIGAKLTIPPGKGIFISNFVFNDVISPTGKIWMDRNLGASQVATSSTDYLAYGNLYQWGRGSDGHQLISWLNSTTGIPINGATLTISTTDQPGHSLFILGSGSNPYDWRVPQNDNLWQGLYGINNPCPLGYRVPSIAELTAEWNLFPTQNIAGAFASVLKLPVSGLRNGNSGIVNSSSTNGLVWSSSIMGIYAQPLNFNFGGGSGSGRAVGMSIRCIKN